MAAGEALLGRKLFNLTELKNDAQAAIEKKSSRLGLSVAILSFVLFATLSAYGMIMGACYIWLAEYMAPQMALLATALVSGVLALSSGAVWKYRK